MPYMTVLESKVCTVKDFIEEKLPPVLTPATSETLQLQISFLEDELNSQTKKKVNLNKKKGTDFERCVGSLYEKQHYVVEYYGQEKNAHDLGRDLICKFNNYTVIVQCKFYKDTSIIKLYDIYILYASMKHYASLHPREIVSASFWTNQNMLEHSREAYSVALELGIQVYQQVRVEKLQEKS